MVRKRQANESAEESLRRANQELGRRVAERTAEAQAASRYASNTNRLLALFAQKISVTDYLQSVMEVIQEWSGCQAMGIRMADENGEIPYHSWTGFEPEFIEQENRLSLWRDTCCCLRAISQNFEKPDRALLTAGGSYRCDDQIRFLEKLPPEKQERYRGTCMRFGFTSVAVIPCATAMRSLARCTWPIRGQGGLPPGRLNSWNRWRH